MQKSEVIEKIRAALADLDAATANAREHVSPEELAEALGESVREIQRWLRRSATPGVSVSAAAELLDTSRTTIYRLIESGELEAAGSKIAAGVTPESLERLAASYRRRVSVSRAAELLGVDRSTVDRMIEKGMVDSVTYADRTYVDRASLDEYMRPRFPAHPQGKYPEEAQAVSMAEGAARLGVSVPTVRDRAVSRGVAFVELYSGRLAIRTADLAQLT